MRVIPCSPMELIETPQQGESTDEDDQKLVVQAEEGRQQKASEAQSSNWSSKVSGINFDEEESHLWWRCLQSECSSDLRASLNVFRRNAKFVFLQKKEI